jgi:hypothetical protein
MMEGKRLKLVDLQISVRIINWKTVASGWWLVRIVRWCTDLRTLDLADPKRLNPLGNAPCWTPEAPSSTPAVWTLPNWPVWLWTRNEYSKPLGPTMKTDHLTPNAFTGCRGGYSRRTDGNIRRVGKNPIRRFTQITAEHYQGY